MSWNFTKFYEKRYYKYYNYYSCRTKWDREIVLNYNPDAIIFNIWEIIRPLFFINDFFTKGDNLLFLGGTNPIKGLEFALKAFALIKDKIKGKLLIAGSVNKNILKELLLKTKVKDDEIEVTGFLSEEQIVHYMKMSFCLLHTTLIDNSPNSICEAQVLGLPVIATNVGGVSSLIKHRRTGLLTSFKDNDIANFIVELYKNDNLWEYISKESRKVSRQRHNPERITSQTLDMYKTIIYNDVK